MADLNHTTKKALAVRDELAKSGVRGGVTITEPKVTGTWVDGTTSNMSFGVIAAGRKIPSVIIHESYPPAKP